MSQAHTIGGTTKDERDKIAGAIQSSAYNQPNGPVQLDGDGNIPVGSVIVQSGAAAVIDEIVLDEGEVAITTDTWTVRLGDGVTAGGHIVGSMPTSDRVVEVVASGSTKVANGAILGAAVALANTRDKHGDLIGVIDRVVVSVEPGLYNVTALGSPWHLTGERVDIVAAVPGTVFIEHDATDAPCVRISAEINLRGLTFVNLFNSAPVILVDPDLAGTVAFRQVSCFGFGEHFIAANGDGEYVITCADVYATGSIMHGVDGVDLTTGSNFTNVTLVAGTIGGGETAAGAGSFTGWMRNCRLGLTSDWNLNLNGVLEGVQSFAPITRLNSSARVYDCIFDVSAAALQNNSVAATVFAHGNLCRSTLLGTSVTNAVANATNVINANTDLIDATFWTS